MESLLLKVAELNCVYTCRNTCGLDKTLTGLSLTSGIYQEPIWEQQPVSDLNSDTQPCTPQISSCVTPKIPPTLWVFHTSVPNCADFSYLDFRYLELKVWWSHTDQMPALYEILGVLWILTAHLWVHKECRPACSASHSTNATGGLWIVSSHPFFVPFATFQPWDSYWAPSKASETILAIQGEHILLITALRTLQWEITP